MGIGILYNCCYHGVMWGVRFPRRPIQSWRGMKILEQVKYVLNGTIPACWYAGASKVWDSDRSYLDDIARQFGGNSNLEILRGQLFISAPTKREMAHMLKLLQDDESGIDTNELNEEVMAGRIKKTPLVKEFLDKQIQ